MVEKHNLYGALALVIILSLYIGLPESLFAGMAYQDYQSLSNLDLITNFDKIANYYSLITLYGVIMSLFAVVLSFYFISKQNKNSPSILSTIAVVLNVITLILVSLVILEKILS